MQVALQMTGRWANRHKRAMFYAVSWFCFVLWLLSAAVPESNSASWLFGLGWGLTLVMWCREDAILAGRPLPTLSLWVVLLAWPVAVPACVVRIYGVLIGLLLTLLHVLIYAAVTIAFTLYHSTRL